MSNVHHHINYVEFPLTEKAKTIDFYTSVFAWRFTEWGDVYLSFDGAGLAGGFNAVDHAQIAQSGALVILYSENLERTRDAIVAAGGVIVKPIYAFPGGRRFHFSDPNGNELAVWSAR